MVSGMGFANVNVANVVNDATSSSQLGKRKATAEAAGKDFEQMFLNQMMQPMFDGLASDGLGGDPETDDIYRGWMVEEYSKLISARGGIGLANVITKALLKQQEV